MAPEKWVRKIEIKRDSVTDGGDTVEKQVEAKWREIWEEQCKIDQNIWGIKDGERQPDSNRKNSNPAN